MAITEQNTSRYRQAVLTAAIGVVVAFLCGTSQATELATLRRFHPWGRFEPGSWKLVRVETETLDAEGKHAATSVANTRTTLEKVDEGGVTLRIEIKVEVEGKEVESETKTILQGWHGEDAEREATVKRLGEEPVTIAEKAINCDVEEVELTAPAHRIVTRTWYSDRISPYVLRRKRITYDRETGQTDSETEVEVLALSRPRRIRKQRRQVAELMVTSRHAGGRTRTRVWSATDVPGGVVEHESEEFDKSDRVTRRSRLELLDYEVKEASLRRRDAPK